MGEILKLVTGQDGAGTLFSELAFISALRRRGYRVTAIVLGSGPASIQYAETADTSLHVPYSRPDPQNSFLREIMKPINTSRRDTETLGFILSHLSTPGPSPLTVGHSSLVKLAGRIARKLGLTPYWYLNTPIRPRKKVPLRWARRRYGIKPIANSYYTRTKSGLPAETPVVYPGYNPERVTTTNIEDLRRSLGIPVDSPVFGMSARLTRAKAQDLLIEAFSDSRAADAGAHLVIAGGPLDSKYGAHLQKLAASSRPGQVHFTGFLTDIRPFYATIDVAVSTLRTNRAAEAFGVAVAEALGAGRPVVTHNCGGPAELVDDGTSGWLVGSATRQSYRAVLERAWEDRAKWHVMGETALRTAETLTVDRQVDFLIDALHLTRA